MKVCENCCEEIGTRDGVNKCSKCRQARLKKQRKEAAKAMRAAYESCGLVRVQGALGGIYYE
jgi:hypothetical protein